LTVEAVLAELHAAGVQFTIRDDHRMAIDDIPLVAEVPDGVDIGEYAAFIRENKRAFLAALTPLDPDIVASEAARCSAETIADRIARIAARLGGADERPGDRLSLRYWEAIAVMRERTQERQDGSYPMQVGA
jgi:hypothetical protein